MPIKLFWANRLLWAGFVIAPGAYEVSGGGLKIYLEKTDPGFMENRLKFHLTGKLSKEKMKHPVSSHTQKSRMPTWGNFDHAVLVRAELARGNKHDHVSVKVVEGIVRSSHDLSPLAGTALKLSGTDLEAVTDINGWFSMSIEKPYITNTLTFTHAGYKTLHVPVTDEDFLHVNLKLAEQKKEPEKKRWTVLNFFSF